MKVQNSPRQKTCNYSGSLIRSRVLFGPRFACLPLEVFHSLLHVPSKSTLPLFPYETCFDFVVAIVIVIISVPIVHWLLQRRLKQLANDLLPPTARNPDQEMVSEK